MMECVVRINNRGWGVVEVQRTGKRRDKQGRVAYNFKLYRCGHPEGSDSGTVWHRPKDGIWKLICLVIQKDQPESWFPRPYVRKRRV